MSTPRSSSRPRLIDARPALRRERATAVGGDASVAAVGRRTATPWGFAGSIVLIVAIESLVTRNWLDLTDPVSLSWRYSTKAVETESAGCELLCLGDSQIKHGLLPQRDRGRDWPARSQPVGRARLPTLLTYFLLAQRAARCPRSRTRPRSSSTPSRLYSWPTPTSTLATGRKCSLPANASNSRRSRVIRRSWPR